MIGPNEADLYEAERTEAGSTYWQDIEVERRRLEADLLDAVPGSDEAAYLERKLMEVY